MSNCIDIPMHVKAMFKEQLDVSVQAVEAYKHDTSEEGTRLFYHHVSMIENINTRVKIIDESKKNIQRIQDDLAGK